MARDPWQLQVFVLADALVLDLYRATAEFNMEERFGLQSQIRRAAVSVVANLVEGCSRSTERDYLRFVEIALGSATETRYLLGLASRLGCLDRDHVNALVDRYDKVVRTLQSLRTSLGAR